MGRETERVSVWLVVPFGLAVAAGSACLGARWSADNLHAELALRPPLVLFDLAEAVRDVPPERLGAAVAQAKAQAERLAAGGFLVLDAQAVMAAPAALYLGGAALGADAGDPPR